MTADLHLLIAPTRMRHLPTEIDTMQFTRANRRSVEAWLTVELGPENFSMTDTHLVLHSTQGDRDISLGGWVNKRRRADGSHEFYSVEDEVIANDYEAVTA